jgi:osmotically-inducible protein OsmY
VKTILLTDIGADALKIDVDVTNGIVSLRGKLGNAGINQAAIKKTQSIKGVKKVVNLLD